MGRFVTLSASSLLLLVACEASINHELLIIKDPKADSQAIREAVTNLGELLAEREASGRSFDEGELLAVEFLKDVAKSKRQEFLNRMSALSALRRLKGFDFTEIYLEALENEYWAVRWEAAKSLAAHPRPRASPKLAERLAKEREPEVLLDISVALANIGDRVALKALLDAFLDGSERYTDNRLKIHDALKRLSGRNYDLDDGESWWRYRDEEFAAEDAGANPPAPQPDKPTPAEAVGETGREGGAGAPSTQAADKKDQEP